MEHSLAGKLAVDLVTRAKIDHDPDTLNTWIGWLEQRIGGADRAPEWPYFFETDGGVATLALVAKEGVRLVTAGGAHTEIRTEYLGPLAGGTYAEVFGYNDPSGEFELEIHFEHDDVTIDHRFVTTKEIESAATADLRDLLRGWAESTS